MRIQGRNINRYVVRVAGAEWHRFPYVDDDHVQARMDALQAWSNAKEKFSQHEVIVERKATTTVASYVPLQPISEPPDKRADFIRAMDDLSWATESRIGTVSRDKSAENMIRLRLLKLFDEKGTP